MLTACSHSCARCVAVDAGGAAIATALREGKLPALERLSLSNNAIGDAALQALAQVGRVYRFVRLCGLDVLPGVHCQACIAQFARV